MIFVHLRYKWFLSDRKGNPKGYILWSWSLLNSFVFNLAMSFQHFFFSLCSTYFVLSYTPLNQLNIWLNPSLMFLTWAYFMFLWVIFLTFRKLYFDTLIGFFTRLVKIEMSTSFRASLNLENITNVGPYTIRLNIWNL